MDRPIGDEEVPVVMADLVPEVAEQCAVRLEQLGAAEFTLGVVGLCK
jgi:hypothetical protein